MLIPYDHDYVKQKNKWGTTTKIPTYIKMLVGLLVLFLNLNFFSNFH